MIPTTAAIMEWGEMDGSMGNELPASYAYTF
jgi:hypothetical protein